MSEHPLANASPLVREYLEWLGAQDESASDADLAVRVVRQGSSNEEPFLSVICRTQGIRVDELSEALDSVQAQSNKSLQLILVCHDASDEGIGRVCGLVEALDGWLADCTTVLAVEGGTRSRPLNGALSYVGGRYFAVLDEDDLVYPNWVEAFERLAAGRCDRVLYCFVESQPWRVCEDGKGGRALVAASEERGEEYCKHPNGFRLLIENQCPFMGLAFPSTLVRDLGFRFDERLETTEDWQFFIRARNVFPLVSSEERVALYRLWSKEGGNSTDAVGMQRWAEDAKAVRQVIAGMPLLFPPGLSRDMQAAAGSTFTEAGFLASRMELFGDAGAGFTAKLRAEARSVPDESDAFEFTGLESLGELVSVRVDPAPHGPLALAYYTVEVFLADGTSFTAGPTDTVTNGRTVEGQCEFTGDDPQVMCPLPYKTVVSRVVFRCRFANGFIDAPARRGGLIGKLRGQ